LKRVDVVFCGVFRKKKEVEKNEAAPCWVSPPPPPPPRRGEGGLCSRTTSIIRSVSTSLVGFGVKSGSRASTPDTLPSIMCLPGDMPDTLLSDTNGGGPLYMGHDISWRKVHKEVQSLRYRIFRCSRAGNFKKSRRNFCRSALPP